MRQNGNRTPFSPIGEKARMRATHNATTALTPTLSLNRERGTTYVILIILVLCLLFFFRPQPCSDFREAKIQTPKTTLSLALAETPEEQSKGLSGCTYIPKNSGMYFSFESSRPATFWMKDMVIPIDIIWIKNGEVVGIEKNVLHEPLNTPDSALKTYSSPGDIDAVLEIEAGKAEDYGIQKGSNVGII